MTLYARRKPWDLEPHYSRHVAAMTTEALHEKAAIAAELAWRDQQLDEMHNASRNIPALTADELWWLIKLYSTSWQWVGPDGEAAIYLPRLERLGLAEPTKVGESECFRITTAGRERVRQACGREP